MALAILMLPVVLRTTEEMLKLVPKSLREASLALGAPEWKTSFFVLLPAAMTGVVTGLMLAVARVAGETAPLLFTALGSNNLSTALDKPIASLPLVLFKYAVDPSKVRNAQAWAIALLILVLVLVLNIAARLITLWRSKMMAISADEYDGDTANESCVSVCPAGEHGESISVCRCCQRLRARLAADVAAPADVARRQDDARPRLGAVPHLHAPWPT